MEKRPSRGAKKGSRGDFVPFRLPLAGSRDSVPCGVWGNAPTVPRQPHSKGTAHKGAGSEASLPVTTKPCNTAPSAWEATAEGVQRAIGKPSGSMAMTSMVVQTSLSVRKNSILLQAGDFASAEATKGLSDRPLETFGRTPMLLDFYRRFLIMTLLFSRTEEFQSARRFVAHAPACSCASVSITASEAFG